MQLTPGHRRRKPQRRRPEVVPEHDGEPEDLQLSSAWTTGQFFST
jgi:hypothetical protein